MLPLRPILGATVALFLTACAPGRLADLKDVGKLSLGTGIGLSVDAQLGALTHPSLGFAQKQGAIGYDGRESDDFFYSARVSFPQSIFTARAEGAGILEALNSTGWVVSYKQPSLQKALEEADKFLSRKPPREFGQIIDGRTYGGTQRTGHWLPIPGRTDAGPYFTYNALTDFNAGLMVGPFAGRAGVNPLELVDLLLGFVSLDIAGDDPDEE
jgi:hypothetical protein